jgi:hypothetical protein
VKAITKEDAMSRTYRALTVLALGLALSAGTAAAALAAPDTASAAVEDQNDRLLRSIEAAQAERTQAAVEQVRAGERNLGPAPVVTIAPQPVPAADDGVNPLVVLLVGLAGGLIGGAAIAAGVAANRRHGQRAVAA